MASPGKLLSQIWIHGFKSISSVNLDLRPLTVLVGENSAGKSSVLQAILFLAQTASRPTLNSSVSLNGSEVELGNFDDVVHSGLMTQDITIGVSVSPETGFTRRRGIRARPEERDAELGDGRVTWQLSVEAPEEGLGTSRIKRIEIRDETSGARLEIERNEDAEAVEQLYEHSRHLGLIRSLSLGRTRSLEAQRVAQFKGRMRSSEDAPEEESFPGVAVDGALPTELFAFVSEREALARRWIDLAIRRSEFAHGYASRRSSLRDLKREREQLVMDGGEDDVAAQLFPRFLTWVQELNRSSEPARPRPVVLEASELAGVRLSPESVAGQLAELLESQLEEQGAIESAPSSLTDLASGFRFVFRNSIHYLGPLRADPAPAYRPGQTGDIAPIGLKGEFTISTLHAFRNEVTVCPLRNGEQREMKLGEAVDYWLKEFAVASGITTREVGRPGIEVAVIDPQTGASRDLTGVGVGISQLLPVIVLCLYARPGELVLLEQPELHLHPAPQQILGDFLLNVALSGRQLLIETHSEYLINRLRLRVADDDFGDISELLHIWYAKRKDGRTSFDLLKPNRFGAFDEWPEGFFDQSPREAEAILRAAAKKRRSSG